MQNLACVDAKGGGGRSTSWRGFVRQLLRRDPRHTRGVGGDAALRSPRCKGEGHPPPTPGMHGLGGRPTCPCAQRLRRADLLVPSPRPQCCCCCREVSPAPSRAARPLAGWDLESARRSRAAARPLPAGGRPARAPLPSPGAHAALARGGAPRGPCAREASKQFDGEQRGRDGTGGKRRWQRAAPRGRAGPPSARPLHAGTHLPVRRCPLGDPPPPLLSTCTWGALRPEPTRLQPPGGRAAPPPPSCTPGVVVLGLRGVLGRRTCIRPRGGALARAPASLPSITEPANRPG